MDENNITRPTFTPSHSNNFMFILVVAGIAMQLVIGIVVAVIVILNPEFSIDDMPFWALVLGSQVLMFGIPCGIYLLIMRKHIKEILPFRRLGWLNILMIVGLSLTIQPLFMLVNAVSQLVFPNVIMDVMMGINLEGGLWLTLIIVAVVPSIFEEVAFRGAGFVGYKHVKIGTAALINGLVFGMIHMNMNQFFYAFLLGAVFCYFMYYTKSIWAPILAHFVVNGTQSLMLFIMTRLDPEAFDAAAQTGMYFGDPETVIAFIALGVFATFATGAFIAIYIPFKNYNLKRNESEGVVTDMAAAAREAGEQPPKAFTWSIWLIFGIFTVTMLFNYLVLMPLMGAS